MLRFRKTTETQSAESVIKKTAQSKTAVNHKYRLFHFAFCLSVLLFVVFYVIIPAWFYWSPWLRQHAVFLTFLNIPPFLNLSAPESFSLQCPRNLYIESDKEVNLGVWHIPPAHLAHSCEELRRDSKWFTGNDPIILYLHGNAGSRGGGHRVGLYKVLTTSKVKSHVVAMDYRGYGDSSEVLPTAEGVVSDARAVYRWIRKTVPSKRIIVWGHSLGTGVSVYLLERLEREEDSPAGLILEAPFDALPNAASHHPLSLIHRYMPFFRTVFVDSLKHEDTNFNSLDKMGNINVPILIMHAKDDTMIPFQLGYNLYEKVQRTRSMMGGAFVRMEGFGAEHAYGHKNIYLNPNLPDIVAKFIKDIM